jgi:pyrrolidone-carboxylate peptidase
MKKTNIPYGSDTSAGTYRCNDCGFTITKSVNTSLPPCPRSNVHDYPIKHILKSWTALSGQGDAKEDPYP